MAISETITIDAGPAIGALDALGAAAEEAAAKFAAAMDKLKVPVVGGGGADKLAASMDAAAASIDEAVGKIQAAFGKLAGMGDSAAAGLEKIGEAADSAAGPLDAIAGAADEAAAAQDRLAESSDAAGASLDKTAVAGVRAGAAADDAAAGAAAGAESHSKLGEYALGAAVIIGYATDKAMKFNAQMVTLNTQAGVSKNQLGTLSKGVLELAGQVGQSPASLAESLYHVESNMQSLGIKAPQALNMVKVAAEGASVGHANLVDVTNALTASVASGIPGVKNYSQAMGVLNATVGAGDMTMQDLADAMGTGAVAAVKGYGLNIKDVGAALAVFGDNNIRGAKAGTDLRMSVQALAVPVSTASAELKKLGLTQTTLAGDMQSGGLLKALDDLQSKFKANGITAKNEGEVITDLFGKKAGVGLSILMEQMGRLQSKYPDLTKGAADFGQAWATTQQTAQQKLKQLESGAQAMAITLGNIAMPAADKILGGLDKGLEFVQSHAFASKGLTLGLGTLIAGGLTKGIFSGVESGLEGIGKLGSLLKIPGLSTLGKASGATGAAAMDEAAAAGKGAAASLSGAADALDGAASSLEGAAAALRGETVPGLPGGKPGGPGGKPGPVSTGEKVGADAGEAAPGLGVATAGETVGLTAGMLAPVALGAGAGLALALWANQFKKYDHPAPPAQQGSRSAGQATPGASTAWKQYDQLPGAPGENWTSVLGGSAPYGPPAQNIPASRFAAPQPGYTPGAELGRFGPLGGTPQQFANAPSIPMLGAGGHPGTVKIPPVDDSALTAAKAKVQADLKAIDTALATVAAHPGKIPAPDVSALETAKTKVTADLDQINQAISKSAGKPATIPAPDLAGLTGGAAKAGAAAAALTQAVQSALKPAHVPAPDLSALTSARGAAAAAGASVGQGFATGISSEAGAVEAAAGQLAADAAAAMNTKLVSHSPSEVTKKIGGDFDAGFSSGIAGNSASVKAASAQIGSDSVASLLQGLAGGQSNVQNAIQAVMGAAANPDAVTSIQQTIQTLIGDVPAKDTGLVKYLTGQEGKLESLANKQGAIMAQITDAQQIATSAISGAGITTAAGYTPALAASNGPQASQSIITGMQQQLADTKSFASTLAQLQKGGLNATTESQLAQAGTAAGLPLALGLAQGGKGAVAQMNAIESQIIKASQHLGSTGGTAMYNAGQAVTAGLDAPLKAELTTLDKDMSKIADSIISTVQKKLGTKASASSSSASGSTAAATTAAATTAVSGAASAGLGPAATGAATGLGKVGPAGGAAAAGLDSVASAAGTAAAGLGKISAALGPLLAAVQPSSGHAQPIGGGGYSAQSGGGGGVTYHQPVTVHVYGSVVSNQDLADHVQNALLSKNSSNWQAGIVYPGRAL